MDANFIMEHKGRRLYCSLNFGFHKYLRTLDVSTEFEVHISSLSVYGNEGKKVSLSNKEQKDIEILILEKFDNMKLENYERIISEKQVGEKSIVG